MDLQTKNPVSSPTEPLSSGETEDFVFSNENLNAHLIWFRAMPEHKVEVSAPVVVRASSEGRLILYPEIDLGGFISSQPRIEVHRIPTDTEEFLEMYGLSDAMSIILRVAEDVFGSVLGEARTRLKDDPAFDGLYLSVTVPLNGVSRPEFRERRRLFDQRLSAALPERAQSRFVVTLTPDA